jgi:hypothetical protein
MIGLEIVALVVLLLAISGLHRIRRSRPRLALSSAA